MITFNDDGVWEQQQDDLIEFLSITLGEEEIELNWASLMPSVCEQIEDWEFRDDCERTMLEEFENNLEKF